ncbi:MAG: hypothetical protein R2702_10580 [Acidimicrobiales bacterium]
MSTNRIRTLVRGGAAALALAVALVGFTACDPGAQADCTKDCLDFLATNDNADTMSIAHRGGAALTEATIYADAARTQVVGYVRNFEMVQYPTVPITKAYQALPLENPQKVQLKPATTYWYASKTSGAMSKVHTEVGSFKTKQRIVSFTITKVWLFYDSDAAGSGEITMEARINGGAARVVHKDLDWAAEEPAFDPKFTATVKGVMNANTFQVRAWDDDCTFSTCTAPAGASDKVGSNGDTQWSTLTFPVTVSAPNLQYGYGTFKGSTNNGITDIGFYIEGTWKVAYEYA